MAIPPIQHTARLHITLTSGGVAVVSVNSAGIVAPDNLQATADPIIAAFDDSEAANNTFLNSQARATGSNDIDNNKNPINKELRAAASLLVDELNILRQWLVSFKVEVAAATSLADLKTRVATLPNLPDRTMAQAKTAMQNKINAGDVD